MERYTEIEGFYYTRFTGEDALHVDLLTNARECMRFSNDIRLSLSDLLDQGTIDSPSEIACVTRLLSSATDIDNISRVLYSSIRNPHATSSEGCAIAYLDLCIKFTSRLDSILEKQGMYADVVMGTRNLLSSERKTRTLSNLSFLTYSLYDCVCNYICRWYQ